MLIQYAFQLLLSIFPWQESSKIAKYTCELDNPIKF